MKKVMIYCLSISGLALVLFSGVQLISHDTITKASAITAGTIFYHFGMRLIVGGVYDFLFHNHMDYKKWWFRMHKWEKPIYDVLHVKQWKKHVPTYDADTFDIGQHSVKEIVEATCQSELVHETIMVLSFVPILFSVWFDEILVFVITSIGACLFDSIFVIVQRFNRPRLIKMIRE